MNYANSEHGPNRGSPIAHGATETPAEYVSALYANGWPKTTPLRIGGAGVEFTNNPRADAPVWHPLKAF